MLNLKTRGKTVHCLLAGMVMVLCACSLRSADEATAVTPGAAAEASAAAVSPQLMSHAEATVDVAAFNQRFEAAKALWESHNIDDYSLGVRYSQPDWNIQILTLTVEDGVVIDSSQSCFPQRDCILREIDPAQFTIDKLLTVAGTVGQLGLPTSDVDITFSNTYGYPNAIAYPDGFWNLENFQPAEP